MSQGNRETRTHSVDPLTQAKPYSDGGGGNVLDHWLKDFDARQAALNTRQDEFFNKLGIQVVGEWKRSEEPFADAGLAEMLDQKQ